MVFLKRDIFILEYVINNNKKNNYSRRIENTKRNYTILSKIMDGGIILEVHLSKEVGFFSRFFFVA